MLERNSLARAIEIQQKSYHLLRWVADAIDAGRLPAQFATQHAEGPEAAVEWVRRHHDVFPRDVQVDPENIEALANFFWTYVVTSFDVVKDAGTRGAFGTVGCTCELCVRLVDAGHLKTKKLRARDKRRALDLMTARIEALAAEHDIVIDNRTARSYLDDHAPRRAAGYTAYGESLLERLNGETDGPAVLALWREIAWTRAGSPIKDFRLDAADFVASEKQLLDEMSRRSAHSG